VGSWKAAQGVVELWQYQGRELVRRVAKDWRKVSIRARDDFH
jgi:hypothetical protein